MSTLATVVGSNRWRLAVWNPNKASPDHPLTQSHAKFWGIPEEQGRGLSDIVEVAADGHDISPRCYVLDIGIQGMEDKIWVRADYIRIFEFAEKFYAESSSNQLSPCLVITGQPGIGEFLPDVIITIVLLLTYQTLRLGKTLWRWYALRVCCAQKKPVILYLSGTCWLFVEGVFAQPTEFHAGYYKIVVWTLVDSADNAPESGPPI